MKTTIKSVRYLIREVLTTCQNCGGKKELDFGFYKRQCEKCEGQGQVDDGTASLTPVVGMKSSVSDLMNIITSKEDRNVRSQAAGHLVALLDKSTPEISNNMFSLDDLTEMLGAYVEASDAGVNLVRVGMLLTNINKVIKQYTDVIDNG